MFILEMSDVETLLSVDAGRVPKAAVVFLARDPEAPNRKLFALLAVICSGTAVSSALMGVDRAMIALLVLTGATLVLMAMPTAPEPDDAATKRPTLVVTAAGMIVRDETGLRSWRFDELSEVRSFLCDQRVGMLIVRHDGSRDFLDNLSFERGERLRELIAPHIKKLPPQQA
jgi:hypothetical protein